MKKVSFLVILSTFMMFVLPWAAVTFIPGDNGMAVCFLLFYAIYPLYCLFLGVEAGKTIKTSWYLPFLSALFFLLGTWIFFDMGEKAFLLYAFFYLVLGYLSLGITYLICHRRDLKKR